MPATGYEDHVFINCPFDPEYQPVFNSIIFAVHDAGFVARCALEVGDASQVRLELILRIIEQCKYGIHDISRTELSAAHELPRFNMPFELGLFLGCKRFGNRMQRTKSCLVLDRERYRYQKYLSDVVGQDVCAHQQDPCQAIREVRNWLRTESKRTNIPGGELIVSRYLRFQEQLPAICARIQVQPQELTFVDLTHVVTEWLKENAP